MERFYFHRRNQAADESIVELVAQLKKLSTHCEFGDYLKDALQDRLVCGLKNQNIQPSLLSEKDLSYDKALELAQSMEAAHMKSQEFKGTVASIQKT